MIMGNEAQNNNGFSQLGESPLFNFSLGSKELFHSNFLAWLGENKSTRNIFIQILEKCFFNNNRPDWIDGFKNNASKFEILREYKHFDLCIRDKDNEKLVLVLENKVKSIPSLEQIERYTEDIPEKNENTSLVLLSLIDNFVDKVLIEQKGWKIVSYQNLYDCLKDIDLSCLSCYYQFILEDYKSFICCLTKIKVSDTYLLNEKYTTNLKNLRILDLAQKLQASQLCSTLIQKIKKEDIVATYDDKDNNYWVLKNSELRMRIGVGYSNKSALLDISISLEKNQDLPRLHIQLQGNQYRHAYEFEIEEIDYNELCKKDENGKYKEKVNEFLGKKSIPPNIYNNWLKNFIDIDKDILEEKIKPEAKGNYNSFKGTGKIEKSYYYLFIYKYKVINFEATIDNIAQYIIEDIKQIKQLHFSRNRSPQDIINKYRNNPGTLKDFVRKCESSKKLEENGLHNQE